MTAPENIDTKIPAGAAASTVIPAVALPVAICPHCRDSLFYFQRAVTLGAYDGMLRELVLDMKTDRRGLLAGASASLLGEIREKTLRESGIEVVVPVPMFFARRFWRGVNSPDLIAETLARRLGLPVFKRLMTRVKATRPQFRLTPRQRSRNLDGAFVLHGSSRKIAAAFDGKHVLLVDDILTTGSTCNAASRLLLDAGASAITVAVLARAVPPRK